MTDPFATYQAAFATGGHIAALAAAETTLRQQSRFHELFEVLKMKTRASMGLPLVYSADLPLTTEQQRQLEDGLLAACEEVGVLLLRAGEVQASWYYLRHLSDRDLILSELDQIEVTEKNLEQIVGLLLHEGLDTLRGYRLILEHYGTCNAITTIQSTLYGRSKTERQGAAELLVAHVHSELRGNVQSHISRQDGIAAPDDRLEQLAAGRDYLFADGAYHLDTSHLSSTIQLSCELVSRSAMELAYDLTTYGERLDPVLQYAGEAPFEATYPSYQKFLAAQLTSDPDIVAAAVEYFRTRAEQTDAHHEGTYPIEVYIDLLSRLGRHQEAIDATVRLIPAGTQTTGRGPTLYDLSEQLGDFSRYRELCCERQDTLGFLLALGR